MTSRDPAEELRVAQALGALRALVNAGEDLIAQAIPLTPLEEGNLRGSYELTIIVNGRRFEGAGAKFAAEAFVRLAAASGTLDRITVEVAVNSIYAARQHEELDWHHPLGGQAKYLEVPLRANLRRYMRALELEGQLANRRPRSLAAWTPTSSSPSSPSSSPRPRSPGRSASRRWPTRPSSSARSGRSSSTPASSARPRAPAPPAGAHRAHRRRPRAGEGEAPELDAASSSACSTAATSPRHVHRRAHRRHRRPLPEQGQHRAPPRLRARRRRPLAPRRAVRPGRGPLRHRLRPRRRRARPASRPVRPAGQRVRRPLPPERVAGRRFRPRRQVRRRGRRVSDELDAVRRIVEAAPRRFACRRCGKTFGHRPRRDRHRGRPGSALAGLQCDGPVEVFLLLPLAFVRNLTATAPPAP